MGHEPSGENDDIAGDMRRKETAQSKEARDIKAAGDHAQDERKQVQPKGVLD